jgi:MFS family permease
MLTPYRRVLALPGALAFSMSGLVARLPISMVSLGIVLLVSVRTGSYALAGSISAAYLIANAAFAVIQGRLTDRLGQSRILPGTILVFTLALAMTMWAIEDEWALPLPHVFAGLAGAALPQVGSSVRARWSHATPTERDLHTAFAFEAVVDEAVFMIGPTLVTLLATTVHPLAGLIAAGVSGLVGTLALASQRGSEPPAAPRTHESAPRQPMGWPVLGPQVVVSVGIGLVFGAVEVSVVAFTEDLGSKAAAGPLLAVFALGSLISGFATGTLEWRVSVAQRFRRGTLALAVAMVPLPFVHHIWLLGVMLFIAGFTISPTLIASVSWVEQTVPAARITEGISILTTGLGVGVAPGAALAGIVIDRAGPSPSFWVPVVAGLVAAAIAFLTALIRTRTGDSSRHAAQIAAGITPLVPGGSDPVDHG